MYKDPTSKASTERKSGATIRIQRVILGDIV